MRFATTRWSLVIAAGDGPSERADRALGELCADYWHPLYAYVRRRGYDAGDARDLTQAFFARLIEQRSLAAADPGCGRFRSFLLTAMNNFLASERRRESALKRGGGVEVVSIDATDAENRYRVEPADNLTPEAEYERRWALAVIRRALDDVRRGYTDRGQVELFDALKTYLAAGIGEVPYDELSRRLDRSEAAVRTALSRLRGRWRIRLREVVAETVQDERLVDDELTDLVRALAPPA